MQKNNEEHPREARPKIEAKEPFTTASAHTAV